MESRKLAFRIAELILEKKGENVVIQDLRKITSMTDFFVMCTAEVDVHAKAIMDHIKDQLIYQSIKPWHTEGNSQNGWILLDFVDVVVHIFKPESRAFYSLERLWGDAEIIEIKDENDTSATHSE